MTKRNAVWNPPAEVSREQCLADSGAVMAMPDIPLKEYEDLVRIRAVGLDWDIGAQIYEPEDPARILVGADGRKAGAYLLSGGDGDFKTMAPVARLLAGKFGFKVATMTYPGRLYLDDPSRDWPGDTINPDGTIRTPIWLSGEHITPDQYEVVKDSSIRERYGTRTVLHAKPGTTFWDRMAGWPAAFEEGGKQVMARNLPDGEYSVYVHGHSTGGPFVFMLSQRVPNVAGVMAVENSSFGYINEAKLKVTGSLGAIGDYERRVTETSRVDPFYELYIRTWRDKARYIGPREARPGRTRGPHAAAAGHRGGHGGLGSRQDPAPVQVRVHRQHQHRAVAGRGRPGRGGANGPRRARHRSAAAAVPGLRAGAPGPRCQTGATGPFLRHQGQPRPHGRRLPEHGDAHVRPHGAGAQDRVDALPGGCPFLLDAGDGPACGCGAGRRQDLARRRHRRVLPVRERRQRLMSGEAAKLEYTTHAVHVMTEREIPVAWVEWVIDEPALRPHIIMRINRTGY